MDGMLQKSRQFPFEFSVRRNSSRSFSKMFFSFQKCGIGRIKGGERKLVEIIIEKPIRNLSIRNFSLEKKYKRRGENIFAMSAIYRP